MCKELIPILLSLFGFVFLDYCASVLPSYVNIAQRSESSRKYRTVAAPAVQGTVKTELTYQNDTIIVFIVKITILSIVMVEKILFSSISFAKLLSDSF